MQTSQVANTGAQLQAITEVVSDPQIKASIIKRSSFSTETK
ncbi:hypothetical protein QY895_10285 [Latilactobacillus sakei]